MVGSEALGNKSLVENVGPVFRRSRNVLVHYDYKAYITLSSKIGKLATQNACLHVSPKAPCCNVVDHILINRLIRINELPTCVIQCVITWYGLFVLFEETIANSSRRQPIQQSIGRFLDGTSVLAVLFELEPPSSLVLVA